MSAIGAPPEGVALPSKYIFSTRPTPSPPTATAFSCPATGDWMSAPFCTPMPCAAPELLMSKKSPLTAATARERLAGPDSGSVLLTSPENT